MNITVTAHVTSPIVGLGEHPFMLDGPTALGFVMRAKHRGEEVPPITREEAPDFPLPFERFETKLGWLWKVSSAMFSNPVMTSVEIRRRPAAQAMARFAKEKHHDIALGAYKARNVTKQGIISPIVKWHAVTTNVEELESILSFVTNIGAHGNIGYGAVAKWVVTPGTENAWRNRPLPHPDGTPQGIRVPYWHPARRVPCR